MLSKLSILLSIIIMVSISAPIVNGQIARDTILQIDHQFYEGGEISKIWVEIKDGKAFFEGDILIGDANKILRSHNSRSATISPISSASNLWTNNIVPFDLPATHPERTSITQAITHVMSRTNLTFVPRTNEVNYVTFVSASEGCFSNIGMIGGEQTINMDGNCGVGAGIHEIGHAIGLFHEHTRQDRDNYVNILWNNIIEDKKSNFQKYSERGFRGVDFDDYDYSSVMHYLSNTFSLNGQPTITIKNPPAKPGTTLGNNRLSPIDILSINNLYRILPRPTADIELSAELAATTNPICKDDPFEVIVSLQNFGVDTVEGFFQIILHDKLTGQNIAQIGEPQAFQIINEKSTFQSVIPIETIEVQEGEYLMALWTVDDEGNALQLVQDGEYLNGKEIFISAECTSTNMDSFEFNDTEMTAYQFEYPMNDSLVVISTDGSTIHTNADIDYYSIALPEDVNYILELELKDKEDEDPDLNLSNDVVVSYREDNEEWTAFRNSLFEPVQILNGGIVQHRVKSHFPGDTGSYILKVNINVDPNPLLELAQRNTSVGPEVTMAEIIVMSNRSWTITNDEQWASTSISEGFGFDTISITLDPNDSFDSRVTRFTIYNEEEDLSAEFALTQEGVQRVLAGELRNLIVCNEDSKAIIFVESNTDWIASTEETWIDIIKAEGSKNDYIEIDLSVNFVGQMRSGSISLETLDGQFKNTIRIFQPSRNEVNACIDPVLFEVGPDKGSIQFDVITDQSWTIEFDEDWISNFSTLSGTSSETISFEFEELPDTTELRRARLKVLVENIGIINVLIFQGSNFTNSAEDLSAISDDQIVVYPNPFSNHIAGNIYMESSSEVEIEIIDIQGRSVVPVKNFFFQEGWNEFQVNTQSLHPGLYMIQIVSEYSAGTWSIIKLR